MKYILDSNVFIEAKKRYYPEKVVPSFWEFLRSDKEIGTIKEVIDEIKAGNDNLFELIENIEIFSYDSMKEPNLMSQYIMSHYPEESNKDNFLEKADFPLVCLAKEHNLTIVTHEKLLGSGAKKVSIPNVCEHFDISYLNTFEMLEAKEINLSNYS